jgi:hypothetical protein
LLTKIFAVKINPAITAIAIRAVIIFFFISFSF